MLPLFSCFMISHMSSTITNSVTSPFPNFYVGIKPLLEVINAKIILLFRKDVSPFLQFYSTTFCQQQGSIFMWIEQDSRGFTRFRNGLSIFGFSVQDDQLARTCAKQGCRRQGGPQILADQLTLSQPGRAYYAHHITTCPPTRIFRPSYGPAKA